MNARLLRPTAMVLGVALVGACALLCLRRAMDERAKWPPDSDVFYLPKTEALRAVSLGHRSFAADLVAARTNVYFGSNVGSKAEGDPELERRLEKFLNTVVDLDPGFHSMYMRGAAMLLYTGRAMRVETILAANRLLERGIERFPGDWELRFQLGFNLHFELPKTAGEDHPDVPAWRQAGVEAFRQAALLDGIPSWLPSLVARMLTKGGREDLAVRHLEQAYASANNETTRGEIRQRLALLKRDRAAAELERQAAELRRLVAESYPYAPEAFSLILGPRRAPTSSSHLIAGALQ